MPCLSMPSFPRIPLKSNVQTPIRLIRYMDNNLFSDLSLTGLAEQIFDSLSYSKAASGTACHFSCLPFVWLSVVLRMLSTYVGEEVFLRGVSIYLKRHLYGNSVSKDLWNGIGEAASRFIIASLRPVSYICFRTWHRGNDGQLGVESELSLFDMR